MSLLTLGKHRFQRSSIFQVCQHLYWASFWVFLVMELKSYLLQQTVALQEVGKVARVEDGGPRRSEAQACILGRASR